MASNYFKKHIETTEFIPLLGNKLSGYVINSKGVIIDTKTKLMITPVRGNDDQLYVTLVIQTYGKTIQEYRVGWLLMMTFKPTHVPRDQHHLMDIMFVNDDVSDISLVNMLWYFPNGIESKEYPGYRLVPGATRYCINEKSLTIDLKRDILFDPKTYDGYHCLNITPDVGDRFKSRLHRLLCLAWLPYPANVDELHVNHKDGIKTNNDLDNLEWTTNAENHEHAHEIGLCDDNKIPVLARLVDRNLRTGEITYEVLKFKSNAECGRYFKLSDVTIIRRIATKDPSITYADLNNDTTTADVLHSVQMKNDDGTDWVDVDTECNPYREAQVSEPIIIKNILTNEITFARSDIEAGKLVNYSKGTIRFRMIKTPTLPMGKYLFKYILDNRTWPIFTE